MKPDPNVQETFLHLAQELRKRGAAYIHIVRQSQFDAEPAVPDEFFASIRKAFSGSIIVTGRLTKPIAEQLLVMNIADLVGFGTLFISNPDLPERFKNDWPLTTGDQRTFYGGDAAGYTDYLTYPEERVAR